MEKDKAIQIINTLIASSTKDTVEELVYELIIDKEVDKKHIRNKAIKESFNVMYKTDIPVMDIYTNLSCSYNLSEDQIRYILRK